MKKTLLLSSLMACSLVSAEMLYTDTYMQRSGIVAPKIETGLPNRVDGRRLLHWHRYIVRLTPVVFRGREVAEESAETLKRLRKLIRRYRSTIRYIGLIGHSSSVVDEENRIELDGWSSLWQHLGGDPRLERDQAISLVNDRLHQVYDLVRDAGMPASRIYTENRLDRQPLYSEASAEGRLGNNRVEIILYATVPLRRNDQ